MEGQKRLPALDYYQHHHICFNVYFCFVTAKLNYASSFVKQRTREQVLSMIKIFFFFLSQLKNMIQTLNRRMMLQKRSYWRKFANVDRVLFRLKIVD